MSQLRDVVFCEPIRTPVGGFGGSLRSVPAEKLASDLIRHLLHRTQLDPAAVGEVILGHSYPTMEAPAIGRIAALDAGLPDHVSGVQVDRRCGSGLQALMMAAMHVQTGINDVVLAGGAESMSNAPFYSTEMRGGVKGGSGVQLHDSLPRGRVTAGGLLHPMPNGMIEMAENMRRSYGISRREQDEYAAQSHQRAARATRLGYFENEIVPVEIQGRRGVDVIRVDEHIRPEASSESLSALRPILGATDPESTVTAGNASGQNDAAAVAIVTTSARADELGLRPVLRLCSWATAGVAPESTGIGPVRASELALLRAGLTMADMDLIELNEAFASQVLACTREWGFGRDDFDRLNVNGSGISLGHAIGATGARILATLAWEMERRQSRYGLETMCVGGGQGIAAVFERVA
ncbi:acetyl-CoA acetyltransferase [Subtercola boreus]|uniref:Probable acetyl-CoA acetyltransferase n=1 Tax=Subtercola boreus TaxID=120213 RepID=A0A3E0VC84_9MICO|nr:acetyl-CoA C-acetyltransferase [Subtercola boreus]RFA07000.1 acetyl-CoA acetyltransferase [Subtercola boreus]